MGFDIGKIAGLGAIAGGALTGNPMMALGGLGMLGGSDATDQAVKAQVKASKDANALQKYMYDTSRNDMTDYRDVGRNALYAYSDAMGLPRTADYTPAPVAQAPAANQPAARTIINYVRGQPVYSDAGASDAAVAKAKPVQAAPITPPKMGNISDVLRATPGYQFNMDEGLKAIDRRAATRGNYGSGSYMKDLLRYSQGLADNTYGEYMNRLGTLSGNGQTQTNALAQLGQNYATNAGNNINAAGAARASGYIGQANTLMNGANALSSLYANQQLGNSPGLKIGQMPSYLPGR